MLRNPYNSLSANIDPFPLILWVPPHWVTHNAKQSRFPHWRGLARISSSRYIQVAIDLAWLVHRFHFELGSSYCRCHDATAICSSLFILSPCDGHKAAGNKPTQCVGWRYAVAHTRPLWGNAHRSPFSRVRRQRRATRCYLPTSLEQ